MPPLPADFSHARACKSFCENSLTLPESAVYSVFDLLYQGYAGQRQAFLKKHGRISEYDSENLLYAVIQDILQKKEFSFVDCAAHVSLVNLVKDYSMLTEEETVYARNPLTHVDFLLFRRMDKSPLLAVEVDGTAFHNAGSAQASSDEKKKRIFETCGIPLLRLRTDGSGEKERIEQGLRATAVSSVFRAQERGNQRSHTVPEHVLIPQDLLDDSAPDGLPQGLFQQLQRPR